MLLLITHCEKWSGPKYEWHSSYVISKKLFVSSLHSFDLFFFFPLIHNIIDKAVWFRAKGNQALSAAIPADGKQLSIAFDLLRAGVEILFLQVDHWWHSLLW